MMALLQRLCSRIYFPLGWTLLSLLLLCTPSAELPGDSFLEFEGMDKIAHMVLFGGLVLFWGLYIRNLPLGTGLMWQHKILLLMCISIALGTAIEFIQRYAIPDRSFDTGDILADAIGSILAALMLLFGMKRKKHSE
jgi:hypothetical protein